MKIVVLVERRFQDELMDVLVESIGAGLFHSLRVVDEDPKDRYVEFCIHVRPSHAPGMRDFLMRTASPDKHWRVESAEGVFY